MNIILSIFLIFCTTILTASGGVGGGISQIPQGKDRDKYQLGKAIYNQEIESASKPDLSAKELEDRLEYLQGSLPNTEKRRINLLLLVGKLTKQELEALEYFVSTRFNVKLPEKDKPE